MMNLQIPINPLGYGVAGINIAKSILKIANIHIQPIGPVDRELTNNRIIEALEKNITEHQPNWPLVKIWHQNSLIERIGNGKYYGFPIFELDTFTTQELYHLKVPDEIIICSKWAKKIVENHIDKKVNVVPLGVDREIFNENPNNVVSDYDTYRFFTIGKLEYRKGHDFIMKCFNQAFEVSDDVQLNFMVHNPFLPSEIINTWYHTFKNSKMGEKINFLNPVKSHIQVADFIHNNDCGLFPARAEGWNLELLESMSCGKPVITTNYSAHTEFCNTENTYLIEIENLEEAHDHMGGIWFKGQGNWAELDYEQEEQMIDYMRYCYKNKPTNKHGVITAKKFSWDNSATKLLEIINE